MKRLLPVLTLALFAAPALAHALTFEVLGKCGETVTQAEVTDYATESVMSATSKVLAKAGIEFKTNKEGTYVTSIGGEGEAQETVGQEMRLYGWTYRLNGVEPKEAPSDVEINYGQKNKIQWVYGYTRMDLGKTRCLPTEECAFVASTSADCVKKAEQTKLEIADEAEL